MPSDQLVEDVLSLWRVLRQVTNPARQGDMTVEQFWLLRHLRWHDRTSVGELAEALGITQSSVTTACQRLEKAGLVSRARDAHDERVVRVALTEQGRARIERWRRQKRAALSALLGPLGADERAELQRLMRKILAATEGADAQRAEPVAAASVAPGAERD